jgi:hypothetical protein
MGCRWWAYSAALLAALAGATGTRAADADAQQTATGFSLVQELRFGAFAHDPQSNNENAPIDASFQVLSSPISFGASDNAWLAALINPRLDFGAMINTRGRDSYGFGGFDWRFPLVDRFFLESEFGGAVNDAPTHKEPDRIDVGCPVTFHEAIGLGYQLTPNIDVVASAEHISHANLCGSHNPGITDFGLRIGYKF